MNRKPLYRVFHTCLRGVGQATLFHYSRSITFDFPGWCVLSVVSCSARPDLSSGQRSGQMTIVLQAWLLSKILKRAGQGQSILSRPVILFGPCILV